ncbi:MAG: membrane protein insertion efficiency factor YidD [Desulfosalsimonadaceae bacterium]
MPAESGTGPFRPAISFYRGPLDHLNSVRTGSCPMHPGCSSYSLEAIEKHGPLVGWMMACDRLMRCGRDELQRSPAVLIDGSRRCLDPVSANDWWWHARESAPAMEGEKAAPPAGSRNWRIRIDPQ